ncbi:MAG: glycerol-3-phosphate acyltransferase [SAR202 cluster bacterium]|nr:glycerol-3-phosphate acyltransferase [SAR202 cluster bacterium]
MGIATLLIVAAYLWGAVPTAYIVARYINGIDIRNYGSGNVGASNAAEHVGGQIGLAIGLFDAIGKGSLVVVSASFLDQDLAVQVGIGLAVIVGHNWSVYLRMTGGRGIATSLGVILGLGLVWEFPVWIILILFGRIVRGDTALWTLLGALVLPFLAGARGQPAEIVWMLAGIALLVVTKRTMANWERPTTDVLRVLTNRILWDRDESNKEKWTVRRPLP